MSKYLMRLDDASPKQNSSNWNYIEGLLDAYGIRPVVGVIPDNQDTSFDIYTSDPDFWTKVHQWKKKGWTIAMHGHNHVYTTDQGGLNPIQRRSEFAGLPLEDQIYKISTGVEIMRKNGINPEVFFAPSHTFDDNTLIALREKSDIRIAIDTIAKDIYYDKDFYFIPQQSGRVRRLPFPMVTFCYHPDKITVEEFRRLERFLDKNKHQFISLEEMKFKKRSLDYSDKFLRKIYLYRRSFKLE